MQPRPYQKKQVDDIADAIGNGYKKICAQLPTGGGKTVEFAYMCSRYIAANDKNILILVHREELLKQARQTIYNWYGLIAEPVTADTKYLPQARIYIAMVETANNRLKKYPNYFANTGLVIIDECHLGNFTKLLHNFDDAWTIGYTATAKNTSKRFPLKSIYEKIVCGIDIPELIENGSLCPNRTYMAKNISDAEVKKFGSIGGEYDAKKMGAVYSETKHIENTVIGYEKHGKNLKTLVFNCNIEHSKLVNDAFIAKGYNSRHLDANATKHEREECVQWFKNTDDAILNNVGILTTGFDEPSVKFIIVNKKTKSLPLWLQMCGRGSRPYEGKDYFIILDMGENSHYSAHGDWCDAHDWNYIFYYPGKPKEGNVAPTKNCVECDAIIHASARVCKWCEAVQPVPEPTYDDKVVEFELVTKQIDVQRIVTANAQMKPYYSLHQIKHAMIEKAKSDIGIKKIDDEFAYKLLSLYQEKVKEWCGIMGKPYNEWHKATTGKWFLDELEKLFKWKPPELSIAI